MAFTYCTNCGEKIDDSEVRCPHCGHVRGQERSYTYGQEASGSSQNGYNQGGYNQNGYNQNGYNQNGYNQNGYNQNGYNQNGYNQGGYNQGGYNQNGYNQNGYNPNGYNGGGFDPNGYYPNGQPQPPQKRPLNVGGLVFSILNIVFGCCGVSMIFGIIGLVFTIMAQNAPTDKEAEDKSRIALIVNIIGVVMLVLYMAVYFTCLALGVMESLL